MGAGLPQFFDWLQSQIKRPDIVGQYARVSICNIRYPRTSRLQVLLKYEPEVSRTALKVAHKEWRKMRSEVERAS